MRVSAKGRYALAAVIEIARQSQNGELVSVVSVSDRLGISKIFLEQAIALLKKGNVLVSTKGSRGGYHLARGLSEITALDVLQLVENALFEEFDQTTGANAPEIETTLRDVVWNKLDASVEAVLSGITIADLVDYASQQSSDQSYMINL
ncbi:MAG: Rrf2 family transcriptional regulator [Oscillospiraceae bacterium]|jgi:Rrf2 family protein|nr:Rrf2 family transcriptional regulator [Oscillospiraceae bacterium]